MEIEKLHFLTCKQALGVKESTPNDGVYAELGRVPLLVTRQVQTVKFAKRIQNLNDKYLVKKP